MGSRANTGARLVVDNSPWAREEAGEDAVLAEFADESTLGQAKGAAVNAAAGPEPQEAVPVRRSTVEIARTAVLACLSAMALGASFAIGFGYVWSDRATIISSTVSSVTTHPAAAAGTLLPLASWPIVTPRTPLGFATALMPQGSTSTRPQLGLDSEAVAESRRRAEQTSRDSVPARTLLPTRGRVARAPAATTIENDAAPASVVEGREPELESMLSSERLGAGAVLADSSLMRPNSAIASARRPTRTATVEVGTVHTTPNRVDLDSVRHTIALYQSAYSQMDIGAMAAVWPSLDTSGVERAFAGVERQVLTLDECRVTTAGNLATAVCPGQVRYVGRVGSRQMQQRQGTWTIALERDGDAWQFVRLNVR